MRRTVEPSVDMSEDKSDSGGEKLVADRDGLGRVGGMSVLVLRI
jgi:hypothetical protein